MQDGGDNLQEGTLAGTVLTDNAKRLAAPDIKRDIVKRGEIAMEGYAIKAEELFEARARGRIDGVLL